MKPETCRSCGCEIVWLMHERTQKPAPIETAPAVPPKGNILPMRPASPGFSEPYEPCSIESATLYRALGNAARLAWHGTEDAPPLWQNHFVGCKDAPHWHDREAK